MWMAPALRKQPGTAPNTCLGGIEMAERTCSVDGCASPASVRGMCKRHYNAAWYRARRTSTKPMRLVGVDPEIRFWSKVEKTAGGCWYWRGWFDPYGYGRFDVGRRSVAAHRFAYELQHGAIAPGLQLDHLCRVHDCVNPAHLEPVTQQENIRRGQGPSAVNARRTECQRGHPFDLVNTYVSPKGKRMCRACIDLRRNGAPQPVIVQ